MHIVFLKQPVMTARAEESMQVVSRPHSKESHSAVILNAMYHKSMQCVWKTFPHLCLIVSIRAFEVCQLVALLPPVGTNKALHMQNMMETIQFHKIFLKY